MKDIRNENLLKPFLVEAFDNIGLRTNNIIVKLIKKKTDKGIVETPYISIHGLEEDVMSSIQKRFYNPKL